MSRIIMVGLIAALLCGCVVFVRSTPRGTTATVVVPPIRVEPALEPVPGTDIMYAPEVTSGRMLFYNGYYYRYWSGRWYRSTRYDMGWIVVSTLPSIFYNMPHTHPVYVHLPRRERHTPGRPPWTSLRREPRMVYIQQAGIYYAKDLNQDLFRYGSTWYWFHNGVWYSGRSYNGPWGLISNTPTVFSRIPKTHPKYKVIKHHTHKSPVKKLRDKSMKPPTPAATPTKKPKKKSPVRKLRERAQTPPAPPTPARTPAPPKTKPVPPPHRKSPTSRLRDRKKPTTHHKKGTPAAPATPATPHKKGTPATPATPATPHKKATPATPHGKGTPGTPATPAPPGKGHGKSAADKLREKSHPATPATPATPGMKGKPATPATPATPASAKKNKDEEEKEKKEKKEKEEKKKRKERYKR